VLICRNISTCIKALVSTFEDRECRVVGVTAAFFGFLDRSRYFLSQVARHCTHEAEWTLFQTHYFSGNLVAPGIETRDLWVLRQEF
jgi:hypothetical protein